MEDYRSKVEGLKAEFIEEIRTMLATIEDVTDDIRGNPKSAQIFLMVNSGVFLKEVFEDEDEMKCVIQEGAVKNEYRLKSISVDNIAEVADLVGRVKRMELAKASDVS